MCLLSLPHVSMLMSDSAHACVPTLLTTLFSSIACALPLIFLSSQHLCLSRARFLISTCPKTLVEKMCLCLLLQVTFPEQTYLGIVYVCLPLYVPPFLGKEEPHVFEQQELTSLWTRAWRHGSLPKTCGRKKKVSSKSGARLNLLSPGGGS